MIAQTPGIVLASFPYSESSVIAKVYTRDFGLNSFLIKGARSPRGKQKLAAIRHLNLIDVNHYRGKSELFLVKDIRIGTPLLRINSSREKSCICLFLSEMLYRCLNENTRDEELFLFLTSSIQWLEYSENFVNFHLCFLVQLSRYLGFLPKSKEDFSNLGVELSPYQDFVDQLISHPDYISERLRISNEGRRSLLQAMINYFGFHLDQNLNIKSKAILEIVFED